MLNSKKQKKRVEKNKRLTVRERFRMADGVALVIGVPSCVGLFLFCRLDASPPSDPADSLAPNFSSSSSSCPYILLTARETPTCSSLRGWKKTKNKNRWCWRFRRPPRKTHTCAGLHEFHRANQVRLPAVTCPGIRTMPIFRREFLGLLICVTCL